MNEKTLRKVVGEVVDDALEPIKEDVKELKEDMGTLKGSVLTIEQTMTSYADSYKINQHNIERIDTRLTSVEENLGIEPPEDLKVPHFASK